MAAPITHIILTDKIYNKYFSDKDKKQLYVATSFPDIRHLGVIDRGATHFFDVKIAELKMMPAFYAGLKFHSYVDEVREKFLHHYQAYSLLPSSPYLTQALKLYEDKLLYSKRSDWTEIADYFNELLEEEKSYQIKEKDLQRWHQLLQEYFLTEPGEKSIQAFIKALGLKKEMADEIIKVISEIEKNEQVKEIVLGFYDNFEEITSSF